MTTANCASSDAHSTAPPSWRSMPVIISGISGVLLVLGFVGGKLGIKVTPQTLIYIASMVVGGWFFGREALEALFKEREIGIELLMSVAAIVAGLLGQWGEAAMLVFLYSISEAAECYTEERARGAIRALMDLAPKTAWVIRDGKELELSVDELIVGDQFIVRPGEAIATDGKIIEGASSVNQAPVTGESVPVDKTTGDTVFAASLNGEGAITVLATKTTADNTLARIIEMVEVAQANKGQSQRFIERFGRRYSPAVLLLGIIIAVIPGLMGLGWQEWLSRATVFIVAAAPCALVISIPITLAAAIGTASRNGVLIKGGVHLENLAKIRVLAMDKTGTLTRGTPEVQVVEAFGDYSEADVLGIAATLEKRSQHPLAQAILTRAGNHTGPSGPVRDFRSLTGLGVRGSVDDVVYHVGSPALFVDSDIDIASVIPRIEALQKDGNTVVLVSDADVLMGLIALSDPLRLGAVQAIQALKELHANKLIMLTGDNRLAAKATAARAKIDEVRSDLKPDDKVRVVEGLARQYGHVAMVGDGVNDAPALAAAHVGIAMGAAGSDVALETADVALMTDDLSKLPYLFEFSQRAWRVIQQNLALSIVVIAVLAIFAVTGVLSLPVAVLAHEVSEFIVIASGLRLLRTY